jgi:hypothetical protein
MIVAYLAGESGRLLAERQQGIAFSAAEAAARVFAEEKDHEGEDETETDREGERNDGHGSAKLKGGREEAGRVTLFFGYSVLFGGNRGRDRTGGPATRSLAGSVVVAEQLPGRQPVVQVVPGLLAIFEPEKVSRVLNFRFSWFREGGDG